MKYLMLFCMILMVTSCASFVPIEVKDKDNSRCQLSTKKLDLKVISHRAGISCHNSDCLVALGISGLYTVSTAVISGSIVLLNNTVHWLEKQGACEDGLLNILVKKHNQPLLKKEGEIVDLN